MKILSLFAFVRAAKVVKIEQRSADGFCVLRRAILPKHTNRLVLNVLSKIAFEAVLPELYW